MRINIAVTSALLTLLTGIIVWSLQPTQKAFSWVELSNYDYLIGYIPGQSERPTGPFPTLGEYQAAIDAMTQAVGGRYYPYAAIGKMGRRLILQSGESYPLFREEYVSSGYFEARRVTAQYGRLLQSDEEHSVVLGYRLAREIFGDPSQAVGQLVTLETPNSSQSAEEVAIVGVLSPSPAQDPDIDTDDALIGSLEPELQADGLPSMLPLFLQVSFHSQAEVQRVVPELNAWTKEYFGEYGDIATANSLVDRRQSYIESTLPKIAARRVTFVTFGIALAASALLVLYAQSYWYLLRRRQLLGVEKALGATRRHLALRLIGAQLPWGILGGLLGWVGLWSLYSILPRVFLMRPPVVVLGVSLLIPALALLVLAVAISLPILTQSAMSLLRGRAKGSRVRPLLWLVYGGLALALAGGLAASQVFSQVEQESGALKAQFGLMYTLQAGAAVIDDRVERAFEAGTDFAPIFSEADARDLEALEGVREAAMAQTIPNLTVTLDGVSAQLRAVAAGETYLDFMELQLAQGDATGCVLGSEAAEQLGAALGQTLVLAGLEGPIPCTVTGILGTPPELWSWLVQDLPELIAPPSDGLGLPLPDYTANPFRSIRILLKLGSPEAEQAVRDWQEANFPDVQAEVIPYTPDVETLLSSLRVQAQLFLLIALLAAALSTWGIIGGFLALLEAERFQIALDRALGLSLRHMTRRWWLQTLGLGFISAILGLGVGYLLTARLYNALALDIPNLPSREALVFSPEIVLAIVIALFILSAGLTFMASRWLKRQSSLTLLKEGVL